MPTIRRVTKTVTGMNVYDVKYWVNGKQRHKRIKAENKTDVERIIALDTMEPGVGIKWSEAWQVFKGFRAKEGKITRSLENTEFAVSAFIKIQGDIEIGKTSPEIFKDFLIKYSSLSKRSTADAANHQRKELLTIARFIKKHTGKLKDIPFENVQKLPAKVNKRAPIATSKIPDYVDDLPEYIKRPILMILFYGLRSSAVCNIDENHIRGDTLHAIDKGDNHRKIPIDETLHDIITQAIAFKPELDA